MAKEINVVYEPHPGERAIHYSGPEGTAYLSNCRNPDMPNVFCSWYACPNPQPGDSIYMLEPVVVHPQDYDLFMLNKFHKVFGCFDRCFENTTIQHKYVNVNYGSTLEPENADILKSRWKSWEERKNGLIVVSSNKNSGHPASTYHLRLALADFFYENGYEVAWYGGIPSPRPYFKGFIQDKVAEITKYRFNVCTENTYDSVYSNNYMTEKLPHAIHGGAVPLYIGCYNIENIVPENGYFDLRPFVNEFKQLKKDPLLAAIKSYSKENFETYNKIAYDFMADPNGLFYHTDIRRCYKKMLEVL